MIFEEPQEVKNIYNKESDKAIIQIEEYFKKVESQEYKETRKEIEETPAKQFVQNVENSIAVNGDFGSGKTRFIQNYLFKKLDKKIRNAEIKTSPFNNTEIQVISLGASTDFEDTKHQFISELNNINPELKDLTLKIHDVETNFLTQHFTKLTFLNDKWVTIQYLFCVLAFGFITFGFDWTKAFNIKLPIFGINEIGFKLLDLLVFSILILFLNNEFKKMNCKDKTKKIIIVEDLDRTNGNFVTFYLNFLERVYIEKPEKYFFITSFGNENLKNILSNNNLLKSNSEDSNNRLAGLMFYNSIMCKFFSLPYLDITRRHVFGSWYDTIYSILEISKDTTLSYDDIQTIAKCDEGKFFDLDPDKQGDLIAYKSFTSHSTRFYKNLNMSTMKSSSFEYNLWLFMTRAEIIIKVIENGESRKEYFRLNIYRGNEYTFNVFKNNFVENVLNKYSELFVNLSNEKAK